VLSRLRNLELTPAQYARVANVGLFALSVIVLTGAAVRLTGSGLGCPDWPKCHGGAVAPLETHAVIEYGNRVFSALVGLSATAAGLLAWRRRPFRRDLAILGILLPLGVAAQGVLGGLTVEHDLAPGFVMAHYGLSMITLIAAVALAWRAHHEPGDRPRSSDRTEVWATRALLPLGGLVVFLGTAATGAGPHAGAAGTGELVHRIDFHGSGTLDWLIHWHGRSATLLGLSSLFVWSLLRRREAPRDRLLPLTVLCLLLATQGIVGFIQYETKLPEEVVWIHVALATATWLAVLWSVAAAGRLEPRSAPEPAQPAEGIPAATGRASA
jgi:heme a synthase